jgi:hypothetical protein
MLRFSFEEYLRPLRLYDSRQRRFRSWMVIPNLDDANARLIPLYSSTGTGKIRELPTVKNDGTGTLQFQSYQVPGTGTVNFCARSSSFRSIRSIPVLVQYRYH